jgi:hypothetical protein
MLLLIKFNNNIFLWQEKNITKKELIEKETIIIKK